MKQLLELLENLFTVLQVITSLIHFLKNLAVEYSAGNSNINKMYLFLRIPWSQRSAHVSRVLLQLKGRASPLRGPRSGQELAREALRRPEELGFEVDQLVVSRQMVW